MSKLIKSLAIVASLFATSAFANDCGIEVFKGFTANHKKEVRVCVFSQGNENFVQYRFGKIGEKPELEIIKPTRTADWAEYHPYGAWGKEITISNGEYYYYISNGQSDDGVLNAHIFVSKNGKQLAKVKLDPNSVETNMSFIDEKYSLSDFGFSNYFHNSNYDSNTTVLAPKRN